MVAGWLAQPGFGYWFIVPAAITWTGDGSAAGLLLHLSHGPTSLEGP
jgi:hypothetical protein